MVGLDKLAIPGQRLFELVSSRMRMTCLVHHPALYIYLVNHSMYTTHNSQLK